MRIPLRATVNLGFTLVLLILLGISLVSYRTARGLMMLGREVSRTRAVEDDLEAILSVTTDAETAQRGFLLTGDESYLALYISAPGASAQRMADLRILAQGDPDTQRRLEALQVQLDGKFSEMRETIALRRTGGLDAALPDVETNRGKNTMDKIRVLVAAMEANEHVLVQQRSNELAADAELTLVVIVIGSVLGLGAVGGSMVLLNLAVSARQRVEEERIRLLEKVSQERARAEAAAHEAQATSTTLRTIIDTMPIGLVVADPAGTVTLVNSATVALRGDVISSRNVQEPVRPQAVVRPDGVPYPIADLPLNRAIRRGESTRDIEVTFRRSDETERAILAAGSPIRDVDGQIIGAVAVYQDITERKRAEEEMRRLLRAVEFERGRFQAILDSAANAIVYLDATTGQVLANPAAERLFGHPLIADRGVSQYVGQILLNGAPIKVEELPSQRALQGETTTEQEMLIVQPDGEQIPVLESAAPVHGSDDRVIGAVIVFQDISALKAIERLREEWTSVVAHDLRQPVTVILGYASIVAADVKQFDPDLKKLLDTVVLSAKRLSRMIDDLLDASRLESRNLRLEPKAVDVVTLTRAVVDRFATVTPTPSVRLQVDGEIPHVMIDPQRFEQILVNLLSNGAKYGRSDTEIAVRIGRRESAVGVSVTNHGDGIPADALPRLFARFQRIHEGRKRRVDGIGLGLYITKGLVEAHGGRIWAESIPGETTTFSFTLPLVG